MKVYAVVEKVGDDYTDYDAVTEYHTYLKEKDAKKRLDELSKEHRWSEYEIREFEVKE